MEVCSKLPQNMRRPTIKKNNSHNNEFQEIEP